MKYGNLLKMEIIGTHSYNLNPAESETLGWGSEICFNKPSS